MISTILYELFILYIKHFIWIIHKVILSSIFYELFIKVILSNIMYELFIKVKLSNILYELFIKVILSNMLCELFIKTKQCVCPEFCSDLNLSYQHKSVTKKILYKNSALGYKKSEVIITLYDILCLFCWSLWECTRWYCWHHAVNPVRLLFKFIFFILWGSQ